MSRQFSILKIISLAAFVITYSQVIVSCAQDSGQDGLGGVDKRLGGTSRNDNAQPKPNALFNFETECGLPESKLADPNAVLVDGNFTSYPIVVEGVSLGTAFTVITQAKINISATAEKVTQNINVELKDSAAHASGIIQLFAPAIVKSKAKKAAAENSGTVLTTSLPRKEWLVLTGGSNPEFKDLLCATSGTKTIEINKGGTKASVTFSPALVNSINPLASVAQMRKEIGSGRSFNVSAAVQGGSANQGTLQGRVTIHEVDPNLRTQDGVVTADIAFEIINDFPGGAYKAGVAHKQVFYIDTTKKQIKAIVNEDDKIDESSQKPVPPAYLIRDP